MRAFRKDMLRYAAENVGDSEADEITGAVEESPEKYRHSHH